MSKENIAPPTHNAYRVCGGVYQDTPCWCAADSTHVVGKEVDND